MNQTRFGYLTSNQIANSANAFAFTEETNCPLTIPININWPLGTSPEQAIYHQHRFLKLAGQWLDYHGIPKAWMWAMEYPEYRLHSHINLHLPNDADLYAAFRKKAKTWAPDGGCLYFSKDADTKSAKYMDCLDDRQRRTKYLLKAMGLFIHAPLGNGKTVNLAQLLDMVDLIQRKGDQGHLPVKRLGVSRSIDQAARAAAGHIDTGNPMQWAASLNDAKLQQVAA